MASEQYYVRTVTGDISPSDVGATMMHEHLFIDVRAPFYRAPSASALGCCELSFLSAPATTRTSVERGRPADGDAAGFRLENRHWIEYNHSSYLPNLVLDDVDEAVAEMQEYLAVGGGTIVELTTAGIRPRPSLLRELAVRVPGLHIVAGTGYYVAATHPAHVAAASTDELAAHMIRHIVVGFERPDERVESAAAADSSLPLCGDEPPVRAGIIGELGCSYPLHADERRVLEAAALAQRATGASISIHPGRDERSPFEIEGVLRSAGADMSRVVVGHLDRTLIHRPELLLELAATGVVLEFDLFGIECSKYHFNEAVDMPSDAQRIDAIARLVGAGFASQIVVSHDIYSKHRLRSYGGHSYDHILRNIVPRMLMRGIDQQHVRQMLCLTPQRLLAMKKMAASFI